MTDDHDDKIKKSVAPTAPFGVEARELPQPAPPRTKTTSEQPKLHLDGVEATGFFAEWAQQRSDTRQILQTLNSTVIPWVKTLAADAELERTLTKQGFEIVHRNIEDGAAQTKALSSRVDEMKNDLVAAMPKRARSRVMSAIATFMLMLGASGIALAARAAFWP